MTYNPDIPQNFPPPREIVGEIRTNFSQYEQVFDNNHSPLNASTQGRHTNVILQQQPADPEVEGNFDSLYGKSVASTSSTSDEVFVKIPHFFPNEVPNSPMQLTFNSVNTTGPQYQSFIAGGYLIYFGKIASVIGTINSLITLTPTPSKILCVIPNPTRLVGVSGLVSAPLQISVTINNTSQFTIKSRPITAPQITGDITWLAIAKQ